MEKVNITIVGAGVIGLGIAAELSKSYCDILIIEKNPSFGEETSSRNSEVIHAGLYYPKDSLKTKTCVEGRVLLYEFCTQHNINHKKIGKLIVAIDDSETSELEALFRIGLENGISDLKILSGKEANLLEPNISCRGAIFSASTGILDSHSFIKRLLQQFESRGGLAAFNTELKAIEKKGDDFLLIVSDPREGAFKVSTKILINCAGLNSDKVSQMIGLNNEQYKLKYCKGDYFRVQSRKAGLIGRLVYPIPKSKRAGLGIHATPDLAGSLRLGPDDEYVDRIDYKIDASKNKIFYESVKSFLPFIEPDDLSVDTSGIRPKLQGPGEPFRDFLIKDESAVGLRGFINLIGIESPGLTASLSIAKLVKNMVDQL